MAVCCGDCAQIIPFASVGDGSTISGVNVTLDDAASGLIPGGSPLASGTYQPTSITGSTSLVFPAPAPLVNASNYAATDGAATLTSTFQNTAPNGTWALYAIDHSGSGGALRKHFRVRPRCLIWLTKKYQIESGKISGINELRGFGTAFVWVKY
jgi:hypothetical protein